MTDCCTRTSNKNAPLPCPECGAFCKPVGLKTLLHQISFPHNMQIKEGQYHYCHNKDCAIGYFSLGERIDKQHLKHYRQIRQDCLCYCFDISMQQYMDALADNKTHAQEIKDFVTRQTRKELCACEIQNPSGLCCLARFKRLERKTCN